MNYCANCGHELGVGRFCTNCGQPVAGRHPGTPAEPAAAEPPVLPEPPAASAPTLPRPGVGTIPPPPRYPLYAEPAPLPPRRRSALPWIVAALGLVVIGAGLVAVLLLRSGGDKAVDANPSGVAPTVGSTAPTPSSAPATPTSTAAAPDADLTSDVARLAVPGTAPASTDLAGNPVTFGSGNLVDGDPQTAWRVAGDASGRSITITFDRPVTITSVGLINGYAKSYRGYNGYQLNRRITAVRWTFEDGTSLTQQLQQRPTMQSVDVATERTSSLRLQIVSTVASVRPNWRDFTAISELSLRGTR